MPYTQHDREEHMKRQQRLHMAEVEAHREFERTVLRPIKDKLDSFGREGLTQVELEIVRARHAYFYLGREEKDGKE